MKITRQQLLDICKEHDIKTSSKGKPVSNKALLKIVQDNIDDMMEDGKTDNAVVAALSTAFDEEEDVEVTGEDPTVPKKSDKKGKGKAEEKTDKKKSDKKADKKSKKASAENDDSDDDSDDEDDDKKSKKSKKDKKKEKKKASAERDKFNSNPNSSAGQINAVLFTVKGKGITLDEIMEQLNDESISRTRVRDHLRRLHTDGLISIDEKGRHKVASKKDE